jgi:hypothetical protein
MEGLTRPESTFERGEDDDVSPLTSIATIPLKDAMMSTRFFSSVRMSDTGAEVTLDRRSLSSLRLKSATSILDDNMLDNSLIEEEVPPQRGTPKHKRVTPMKTDVTPPSNSVTPELTPDMYELTFCGLPLCFSTSDSPDATTRSTVTRFLGNATNSDDWCHGWQAWSYFQLESGRPREQISKEAVQRAMVNRAVDLSSRRDRLATLRKDLYPFQNDHGHNNDVPTGPIWKVRSFRDKRPAQSPRRGKAAHPRRQQQRLPTSSWACGSFSCTMPDDSAEASPVTVRCVDGYDSDPEDFTRTMRSRKRKTSASESEKLCSNS